ncbi:MAG: hypothetical protein JO015_21000 [Verrucomicrobia bacterium]|nr:hypothetical protein [Verrucomicrobiota bacterium]
MKKIVAFCAIFALGILSARADDDTWHNVYHSLKRFFTGSDSHHHHSTESTTHRHRSAKRTASPTPSSASSSSSSSVAATAKKTQNSPANGASENSPEAGPSPETRAVVLPEPSPARPEATATPAVTTTATPAQ